MPFQKQFQLLSFAAVLILDSRLCAQFQQEGSKLVGTGAVGNSMQGYAVALSADGNTAAVGAPHDNNSVGAVFIYTRSNGVWSQQGAKLVDSDAPGEYGLFGSSVALSGDGNTAIASAVYHSGTRAALWVFTRSNGIWTQQGPRLTGSDAVLGFQGSSAVALSADGDTAILGNPGDNNDMGAVWVFTRDNGLWAQQGPKLIGSGSAPDDNPFQGVSVALSADGNTALVGGSFDYFFSGAAWVFTRAAGVWTQQGPKLTGPVSTNTAYSEEGDSVTLSADGNTALLGAWQPGRVCPFVRANGGWSQQGDCTLADIGQGQAVALSSDGNTAVLSDYNPPPIVIGGLGGQAGGNTSVMSDSSNSTGGGARVFVRASGQWLQVGGKLVGSGGVGNALQGSAVAISGDGQTVVVGGPNDNSGVGAVWIFTATASKALPALSTSTGINLAAYTAQPVFTVHVIGTARVVPTGSVTVVVDGVAQATLANLAISNAATFDASASLTVSPAIPPGIHTVRFSYSGDTTYTAVTGGPIIQTINHGPTSVVVSASIPPYGDSNRIDLSAQVTGPWNPSTTVGGGAITFTDSVRGVLGTAYNIFGFSQLLFTDFTPGHHSITATYSGSGDANSTFDPSAPSPPFTFTFHQYAPVVTITSAPNPAVYGSPIAFTATVTPSAPGGPIPTGFVTLIDNSSPFEVGVLMLNASGQGRVTLGSGNCPCGGTLGGGTHVIQAIYSGDINYVPFASSSGAALTQQVTKADTAVALSASVAGELTTMTATLAPTFLVPVSGPVFCGSNICSDGRPSGSIQFWSDSNLIGTASLAPSSPTESTATLTTSFALGNIRAAYSGDSNYNSSSFPVTIPPVTASLTINADPMASNLGEPITLTASLSTSNGISPPSGNVRFFDGANLLGTALIVVGQARLITKLTLGSHVITASYSGDATYPAVSNNMGVYVTRLPDSFTLTSNPTTPTADQPVTLTARLTWQPATGVADPTGQVQFFGGCPCGLFGAMLDRTLLGTTSLTNGVAIVTVNTLPGTSKQIMAIYGGDGNWSSSASNAVLGSR